MKVLLVISLCILATTVVQSVPVDSSTKELQAIIENALKESLKNEVMAAKEDEEKEDVMSAELQEILAAQQSMTSAEAQGFFKRLWKGAKKFVKKGLKYGKKAYGIWNKVKGGIGCEQSAMPEALEDAVAEAFLRQHQNAIMQEQSLEDEAVANDNDQMISAELQEFLATQQDLPVEVQGFFKKLWKKVKKGAKKAFKFGKKAYGIWNKIKGVACEQDADMPEALEDAVAEAFIKQERNALSFAALEELLQ